MFKNTNRDIQAAQKILISLISYLKLFQLHILHTVSRGNPVTPFGDIGWQLFLHSQYLVSQAKAQLQCNCLNMGYTEYTET